MTCSVKLTVRAAHTKWGEVIGIVGDTKQLSNWATDADTDTDTDTDSTTTTTTTDTASIQVLKPSPYPIWCITLQLPSNTTIQYKYVVIQQQTHSIVHWEDLQINGQHHQNRMLATGQQNSQMDLDDGEFGHARVSLPQVALNVCPGPDVEEGLEMEIMKEFNSDNDDDVSVKERDVIESTSSISISPVSLKENGDENGSEIEVQVEDKHIHKNDGKSSELAPLQLSIHDEIEHKGNIQSRRETKAKETIDNSENASKLTTKDELEHDSFNHAVHLGSVELAEISTDKEIDKLESENSFSSPVSSKTESDISDISNLPTSNNSSPTSKLCTLTSSTTYLCDDGRHQPYSNYGTNDPSCSRNIEQDSSLRTALTDSFQTIEELRRTVSTWRPTNTNKIVKFWPSSDEIQVQQSITMNSYSNNNNNSKNIVCISEEEQVIDDVLKQVDSVLADVAKLRVGISIVQSKVKHKLEQQHSYENNSRGRCNKALDYGDYQEESYEKDGKWIVIGASVAVLFIVSWAYVKTIF